MERLTEHHVDKNKGAYMVCSESCQMESCDECEKLDEVVDRLAAYEDTGLTSDEIERILDAYGRGMTLRTENAERLRLVKDISTDRLKELSQAEKAGRLVVVPDWKPGDPPLPGMVIDYDLKGEPGSKGVACYCPPNCPNKDCVGGQCFVGHGTKAKRREEPT